ncbi:hypothetical protein FB45DRAFT_150575 [Roridomyces roridus]|uniref:Uncharacterized protein n=1 Tax=Roridomyces roridus TaxID=1738132 RepID=A0AAD7BH22_9AGAR|nr:hypothetical protein FB45DRAFT_150575 [Roridomyces roridus]
MPHSQWPVPESASLYTESTIPTTVWGPGTLAGRAIMALGEVTLKGLDRLIDREARAIEKRLQGIQSSAPHLTTDMYDDLVELSGPPIYPTYIMARATDLLVAQLNLGYGAAIASRLVQLSPPEARIVLFRLATSSKFEILNYNSISEFHALDLLSTLLQLHPEMSAPVFELLDHLFQTLDAQTKLYRFSAHPILRMHAEENLNIPSMCRTSLSELQIQFSADRAHRWRIWLTLEGVGGVTAESRLGQISRILADTTAAAPELFDAAVDLVDFLRYSQDPEIRRAATEQLVASIANQSVDDTLINALNLKWTPEADENPRYGLYTLNRTSTAVWGRQSDSGSSDPRLAEFLTKARLRAESTPVAQVSDPKPPIPELKTTAPTRNRARNRVRFSLPARSKRHIHSATEPCTGCTEWFHGYDPLPLVRPGSTLSASGRNKSDSRSVEVQMREILETYLPWTRT